MKGNKVVVGVFTYIDDVTRAIQAVKDARLDYRVYSPVPNHDIEHLTMPQRSPVRRITMTGAITGCIFGFALAIWTSLDLPLRVSAKDVVSVPAYFVIGYECTILFGALATLAAIFHFCRLPDVLRKAGFDPRFSADKFGVAVGCDGGQLEDVRGKLLKAGADEVQVREGL